VLAPSGFNPAHFWPVTECGMLPRRQFCTLDEGFPLIKLTGSFVGAGAALLSMNAVGVPILQHGHERFVTAAFLSLASKLRYGMS